MDFGFEGELLLRPAFGLTQTAQILGKALTDIHSSDGGRMITLWRSRPQEVVGAFVRLTGPDGLAAYDMLAADREAIDREFIEAGLPGPHMGSR